MLFGIIHCINILKLKEVAEVNTFSLHLIKKKTALIMPRAPKGLTCEIT